MLELGEPRRAIDSSTSIVPRSEAGSAARSIVASSSSAARCTSSSWARPASLGSPSRSSKRSSPASVPSSGAISISASQYRSAARAAPGPARLARSRDPWPGWYVDQRVAGCAYASWMPTTLPFGRSSGRSPWSSARRRDRVRRRSRHRFRGCGAARPPEPGHRSVRGTRSLGRHPRRQAWPIRRRVDTMVSSGAGTLFLQTSNGDRSAPFVYQDQTAAFIEAAHDRDVEVVAWYLPHLTDLAVDRARTRAAIAFTTPRGDRFDGFALDIESAAVRDPGRRSGRLIRLSSVFERSRATATPSARSFRRRCASWTTSRTGRASRGATSHARTTRCCR